MLLAASKVDLNTGQARSFAALYLLRPGAQGTCSLMARRCDDRTQQPVCLYCDRVSAVQPSVPTGVVTTPPDTLSHRRCTLKGCGFAPYLPETPAMRRFVPDSTRCADQSKRNQMKGVYKPQP